MSLGRTSPFRRPSPRGAALLLASALSALLLARVALAPAAVPSPLEAAGLGGGGGGVAVSLLGFVDLPRGDSRARDLSGLAWEERTNTLYGIRDRDGQIVPVRPSADFRSVTFGEVISVTIPEEWDGEGIALTDTGFFISNEVGPHVYELDRAGRVTAELPLPAHFSRIRRNLALESLTLSPDGRYLFTANEQALEDDGPAATTEAGTTVRILRYDRQTAARTEYAYRTDTVFAEPRAEGSGDRGLAELYALSATELLALERSFVPGVGNNVRIYRVTLAGAANVIDVANLDERTPAVAKSLLVDLATLPDETFPPALQPQPNRGLDNYEGMALGPRLADGRHVLFLISDDNSRDTQVPRLLVLAVAGL